ncbi:hypothetical protein JL721_12812 [Aureococcus anophagefferens]|nr:hypothetical protein JL721_12812 [Aureococcus anophagefferens]
MGAVVKPPAWLTTTASRPYVGTWQLNDSDTAPPYDRRLFSFVPGFHEGHMQRDVKCRDDNSWRWQWRPAGDAAPLSMMGAAELCATLGGVRVLSLGDSLSHQLVETFRVRRLERDFAVPASFGKSDTSGGKSDGKSAATSDRTSGGKGDRPLACDPSLGPAVAGWRPVPQTRPWSLVPHEFRSSVAAFEPCVDAFKRKPGNFGVNHADIDELVDTVAAHMDRSTARARRVVGVAAMLGQRSAARQRPDGGSADAPTSASGP